MKKTIGFIATFTLLLGSPFLLAQGMQSTHHTQPSVHSENASITFAKGQTYVPPAKDRYCG